MKKPFQVLFFVLVLLAAVTASALTIGRILPAGAHILSPLVDPQWGPDVMVDPIPADNHEDFSLAINPTNPNTLLASYKYEDANGPGLGYDLSTDAGLTWSGDRFTGTWGVDMLPPTRNSSVAFNAQGTAFYSGRAEGETANGIFVLTSTNGLDWNAPITVITATNAQLRDQTHLAVDPRASGPNAGSAYLLWRWFSGDNLGIWSSYSRDSGRTWSANVEISDEVNHYASGPSIAVASNGAVYAAFQQKDNDCPCSVPKLFLDRSTDGGATWGADRLMTGAPISKTGALDVEGHDLVIRGDDNNSEGAVEVKNNPSIAIAPTDPNTVYAVWNDGRWDTSFTIFQHEGQHGDIAFSRTTDSGQTWSAPIRINDDQIANGIDQFTPTIAARPDGTIGVTWYDRRVNPNPYLYDLFYSQSTDGGLTWSPNQRVSDVSSDPMIGVNEKGIGDMGEYKALALGPNYVIPSWIDTRSGDAQDFYSDRGVAGTTTPTLTPIRTVSATPSVPPSLTVLSTSTPTIARTATPTSSATPTITRTSIATHTNTPTGTPTGTHTAVATSTSTYTTIVMPTSSPTRTVGASVTPTTCPMSFTDVQPSDYFYAAVRYLYCAGAISGYGDGTFRPYNNTTRGQLCKIIVLAEGFPINTTNGPHFTDVPETNAFYTYIETAYNRGIIGGYSDNTFRPSNNITRAQLCKVIALAEQWAIDTHGGPHFTDVPENDPFYGFIETAYNRGVITGYSDMTFRPGNNATRGQISKIVYSAVSAH